MMKAPAPVVAVQMRTSKTLLLQSLKIKKKEPSATQRKKSTKLSSKTTAKLSTSAKRIRKELAEITLNPPPNCRANQLPNRKLERKREETPQEHLLPPVAKPSLGLQQGLPAQLTHPRG
ncbi:ubiquitin-conjugating enzyme E2 E1-like isoform X3 [Marmota marmota marmota]|uniref:ubiquitin-conjugating enzyme E2 E1-like isoform X3 n=1 Tax=Marmota marmota marmota TaxID=9994 RepID=UPI00209382B1|nr:ubiquitin-conjugating enzyme E2 E1-like isoform X3 [Marmota marmota marmota]